MAVFASALYSLVRLNGPSDQTPYCKNLKKEKKKWAYFVKFWKWIHDLKTVSMYSDTGAREETVRLILSVTMDEYFLTFSSFFFIQEKFSEMQLLFFSTVLITVIQSYTLYTCKMPSTTTVWRTGSNGAAGVKGFVHGHFSGLKGLSPLRFIPSF